VPGLGIMVRKLALINGVAMTIDAPETEIVDTFRIACDDGGGVASGHPRVWLQIPHDIGFVECGYCDKRFVHRDFADDT